MIVNIRYKDDTKKRFISVCYVGVLGLKEHNNELYIMTNFKNAIKERFIPLDDIKSYTVERSRNG